MAVCVSKKDWTIVPTAEVRTISASGVASAAPPHAERINTPKRKSDIFLRNCITSLRYKSNTKIKIENERMAYDSYTFSK
jgi:hypothetical protein